MALNTIWMALVSGLSNLITSKLNVIEEAGIARFFVSVRIIQVYPAT